MSVEFRNVRRKFQVFVSSTYTDLVDERREVIQALLEMDCLPAGMEMFPAANEDQWSLIKEVIDECDYYLVIVGGRYGSVSSEGISYTEMEYDYAVASGIPVMGFVHADPDTIPVGKSELSEAARKSLDAFRDKVMTRMVKQYRSAPELGSFVSRGLNQMIRRNPRPGWVRGDHAMTPEVRAQIAELQAELAEAKRVQAEQSAEHASHAVNTEYKHGLDETTLTFRFKGWETSGSFDAEVDLTYSWDEIFQTLGPSMIDEAPEQLLRDKWNAHMLSDTKRLEDWPVLSHATVAITDNSWGAVIVQLRAVGLIAIGSKKRPPSDKSIYWRLTPAGDDYLVGLRAQKRTKDEPADQISTSQSVGSLKPE